MMSHSNGSYFKSRTKTFFEFSSFLIESSHVVKSSFFPQFIYQFIIHKSCVKLEIICVETFFGLKNYDTICVNISSPLSLTS